MPEIIAGMADLQEKLQELERTLQRKVLIEAAKAGAEIVAIDAAANAPRRTGRLAENMVVSVRASESDIHEATVRVGPSKKQWYGMFSEFGTKKMRPHPFLARALETNRERILTVIRDVLKAAIERLVK